MHVRRSTIFPAALVACLAVAGTTVRAQPLIDVPRFKGNDTGGIIAWSLAGEVDARKLAINHCAKYGKLMKPLASQQYYGGYISFACIWPRGPVYQADTGYRPSYWGTQAGRMREYGGPP